MEEDYGKAMEEVMRGCEFADQLRQVLLLNNDLTTTTTSIFVQNLVNNVINSFNNILFLLDKNKHIPPTTDQMENNFSSIASSVDFKESFMGTSAAGRCYERRNTTLTSEKVTKSPTEDDGHRWRKYGQKKITNSHYTRNYYRCTHKYDQRCLATKQVHRIQQNPPLYKTTYYGHHTCGNLSYPDSILDPNDTSSILLSFNNTFPTPTKQECPFLASSSSLSSSHNSLEHKEEVPASSLEDSNLDLSHDFTLDNSISTFDSDHKDMLYDFLYDSVEFDDHFFHPFDGH